MGCFRTAVWCLTVHSSTTPNRVLLKPSFDGVTGHPQNTLTSAGESLKGDANASVYHLAHPKGVKLHLINSHLYVIFLNL